MSQYPESGYTPDQFRTGSLSATGQYQTGQYAPQGTGQYNTGQGIGQFGTGQDAEARRRAAAEAAVSAFPRHIVTAVLVAHDGARWLDDSVRGLLGQLRAPQMILAVDTGSKDDSLAILDETLGPEQVLQAKRNTGFGTAITHALKQAPPANPDDLGYGYGYENDREPLVEWIWILHDDAEPAPDALLRLLEVGDSIPEAAVIGPKIRGWHDREQLLEVGVTVTADGRRWTGLEPGEHDQGQHADPTRVLSVSSAGMLVRRDVWDRLRGFDRAIPLFRDDLDFCWRVNNAGHHVVTAPRAVLWHAEAAARGERRISAGVSRPHFEDRQHALYALTVNTDKRFVFLTFLRLFFWSLLRSLGLLLNKAPGKAADEVLAALAYAGRIDRIIRARRVRRRTRSPKPVDLSALFPQRLAVFRHTFEETTQGFRRRNERDDDGSVGGATESGPVSEEAESFEAGVPWLIRAVRMPGVIVGLGLTLVTLFAARNVLTGGQLMGGALLPAPSGASDLWSSFVSAWHPVSTGSTSPAPPYLAVVALVATVFFGHASFAVSFLLLGSVPLSGLTAYAVLRRTVTADPLRIWGAIAYALLPAATGAIAAGRLGSAVGIVLLPIVASGVLVAIGGPGRSGSMRTAWPAAFGLAVAMAFAPIIWVLAATLAVGAALTVFWRSTADFATVLVRLVILLATPLAVLAPWSLKLVEHPGAFLLEPGLPPAVSKAPAPQALLLANPGGPGTYLIWLTGGLLLAGLAALIRTGPRRRIVFAAWTLTFAGFAAGLLALQVHPTALSGGSPQQPWTGIPTAAIGFGLIVAGVVGGEGARDYFRTAHFSWRQPLALVISVAAVAAPLGAAAWWVSRGVGAPLQRAAADFRPAVVSVEAATNDQPRALILGAGAQSAVGYGVVRGDGAVLGDADYTVPKATADRFNALVGGLLSDSGGNQLPQLAAAGIRYVVATKSLAPDYVRILDGTPGLNRLSNVQGTELWQIDGSVPRLALRAAPTPPGTPAPKTTTPAPGTTPGPGTSPTTPDPNALKIDSMGVETAKAEIPAAPADGRLLVLAEDADPHWKASIGGAALRPVTVDGWAQGFQVPAAGGTVTLTYASGSRDAWLVAEGLILLFAVIMALPTGRRTEADGPDDNFGFDAPSGDQADFEDFEDGDELEAETDEYEEDEADYAPQSAQAAEYDEFEDYEYAKQQAVETPGYEQDPAYGYDQDPGYQPEPGYQQPEPAYQPEPGYDHEPTYSAPGSGRRRASGEFERPTEFDQPGGYFNADTGEFERPADYRRPRHGSGEYERPDLDETDGYGYGGGYR